MKQSDILGNRCDHFVKMRNSINKINNYIPALLRQPFLGLIVGSPGIILKDKNKSLLHRSWKSRIQGILKFNFHKQIILIINS